MLASDALRFLQFIRERQQKCPEDVFGFRYTVDRDGDLVEVVQDADDSDTQALVHSGKQHSKPKNRSTSSATAPSGQVTIAKTYGRKPKAGSNMDAEETDVEKASNPRKRQAGPGPPRSRPTLPNDDVRNVDDDLPRHIETDTRGRYAEETDVVPRKRQAGAGPPRSRPTLPNDDVPNVGDELPRHIEADATGRSAEMASKSAKGKGKEISRPTATEQVAPVTAMSTEQPPPAGTSATSLKTGPPRGGMQIWI